MKFMKFSIFLLLATTAIEAYRPSTAEFCTYKNCNRCEIVLQNTQNPGYGRFIPICKNIMKIQGGCQKYKRCDVLGECVPRFLQYYR